MFWFYFCDSNLANANLLQVVLTSTETTAKSLVSVFAGIYIKLCNKFVKCGPTIYNVSSCPNIWFFLLSNLSDPHMFVIKFFAQVTKRINPCMTARNLWIYGRWHRKNIRTGGRRIWLQTSDICLVRKGIERTLVRRIFFPSRNALTRTLWDCHRIYYEQNFTNVITVQHWLHPSFPVFDLNNI